MEAARGGRVSRAASEECDERISVCDDGFPSDDSVSDMAGMYVCVPGARRKRIWHANYFSWVALDWLAWRLCVLHVAFRFSTHFPYTLSDDPSRRGRGASVRR
eukprot:2855669-Prymnesium_polylepis.1